MSACNEVSIFLEAVSNSCLQKSLICWKMRTCKTSDQLHVMVKKSCSWQVTQQRITTLMNLCKNQFQWSHYGVDTFVLLHFLIATATHQSTMGGTFIENKHIGDFLRVSTARKLHLSNSVDELLPDILLHNIINNHNRSSMSLNIPEAFENSC